MATPLYYAATGSIYLDAKFVLLEGPHARRRVWSLIGLLSQKGPEWANMGRSFVRGILNSARGLSEKDTSPQAQTARRISGFADLDGIEFLAKIDVGKDQNGEPKNEIRLAVTPNQKDWEAFQQAGGQWRPGAAHAAYAPQAQLHAPAAAPGAPQQPAQAPAAQPANPNRPAWAQ